MTETPGAPITPVTTLTTKLTADWSWILHHLLLIGVAGALVWVGVYEVQSFILKERLAQQEEAKKVLDDQTLKTQALLQQLDNQRQQFQLMVTQMTQQNQALASEMRQRDAATTALLTKIATMSAPQVAADIQPKLRAGTATVIDNGVKLDLPAARDVDEQLTEGVTAKQDLKGVQQQLTNQEQLTTAAQNTTNTAYQALGAEQQKGADAKKYCDDQISTIKADAAKSKTKWAIVWGAIGYIIRVATVK